MIKIPRGTQDILPQESAKWRYIENKLDELMKLYNDNSWIRKIERKEKFIHVQTLP